jgi:Epoxide hydrolase N terminus
MSTAETATEIRPFQVAISDEALEDLRRRIAATQWPEKETVGDSSQGVPLAPMQELAHYWATDYDWRKVEAQLHAVPQFMTEIDGLDIHFIHANAASAEILLRRVQHCRTKRRRRCSSATTPVSATSSFSSQSPGSCATAPRRKCRPVRSRRSRRTSRAGRSSNLAARAWWHSSFRVS